MSHGIVYELFLIFSGSAVLSTVALFFRQSLMVAYILLGIIVGNWNFSIFPTNGTIQDIGQVGIIFLLFLLGLNMPPQKLFQTLKTSSLSAVFSSLIFFVIGALLIKAMGFSGKESIIGGAAIIFSSTAIGIKLLPKIFLSRRHVGTVVVSILLIQDIIAVLALFLLHQATDNDISWIKIMLLLGAIPILMVFAFFFCKFVLNPLIDRFCVIQEYVFLVAIGWCLALATLAHAAHLSDNIGAFIAGISLTASTLAPHIAEKLKPLRDFCLVIFFFYIGATFNLSFLGGVFLKSFILATVFLALKPFIFHLLMNHLSETNRASWQISTRLGQFSEFTLLLVYAALGNGFVSNSFVVFIQGATLISFIVSTYLISLKYPTPVGYEELNCGVKK